MDQERERVSGGGGELRRSPIGSGTLGKDGFQLRESGDGWKANVCFHLDTGWFEALRVQNGGPEMSWALCCEVRARQGTRCPSIWG